MGNTKIAWMFADNPQETNTSKHRIYAPAQMMSEAGYDCYISYIGTLLVPNTPQETLDAIDSSEVIVLERLILSSLHDKIKEWRSKGKRVYATFDDAYHIMPTSQQVSRLSWLKEERPQTHLDQLYEEKGVKVPKQFSGILNEFRKGLSLCNASFVPSKILMQDYGSFGEMRYVPNFLYPKLWEGIKSDQDTNDIVIGWGGSLGHLNSWQGQRNLIYALGNICRDNKNVRVHLQAASSDVLQMFDLAKVRYTTSTWCPFEEWPKMVGQFTIGMIPLSGGRYDAARSDLKALENSMAYAPWIATDDVPYKDSVGGLRVRGGSVKDWQKPLERLIDNIDLRKDLSEQGHAWAVDRNSQCVSVYEKAMSL